MIRIEPYPISPLFIKNNMKGEVFDTKLYELIGMASGRFATTYCGVRVLLKFDQGFSSNGLQVGQLITNNKFIQDAIENDARFGRRWRLKQVFERPKEEPKQEEVVEEQQPVVKRTTLPKREQKPKAEPKKKEENKTKVSRTIVETVTNRNDAAEWFAEKGSVFTTDAELQELMEKFDVDFPNLHL